MQEESILGIVSMIGGGYYAKVIREDDKYFPAIIKGDNVIFKGPAVDNVYEAYFGLEVTKDKWKRSQEK